MIGPLERLGCRKHRKEIVRVDPTGCAWAAGRRRNVPCQIFLNLLFAVVRGV